MNTLDHIEEILGHLGAAISQSLPADDQINMAHVEVAYQEAKQADNEIRSSRASFASVPPASWRENKVRK